MRGTRPRQATRLGRSRGRVVAGHELVRLGLHRRLSRRRQGPLRLVCCVGCVSLFFVFVCRVAAGCPASLGVIESEVFSLDQLDFPIVQAPLAGGPSTPELAAAVSGAGGFGFVAAGYKTPEVVRSDIAQTRSL